MGGWEWVSGKAGMPWQKLSFFFLPPLKLEMSMEPWT